MSGEPKCTFIAFCDLVITEAGTGKNSLIGTFPSLATQGLPLVVPQLIVHVTISNFIAGNQDANVAVNLTHQASGAVVGSRALKLPIAFQKNLSAMGQTFNLNLPFQNLVFNSAGPYLCEVLYDGDPIGDRILEIKVQSAPKQPSSPPQ